MKTPSILAASCACLMLASTAKSQPQRAGDLQMPLIATAESAPGEKATAPTGHLELFNAKDFSGWTFCLRSNAEPANTFTVKDGLIHCTGQPYGYMRTKENYRDYKLTVEWRFVKPVPRADNSGVFVHLQPPDQVWPKCIECQGQYHHQGDLITMGGAAVNGQPATNAVRSVRMKEAHNEKPAGEWNTYEIIAAGDTLKVSVNGRLMNEAKNCNVSSGAIAIQSEGGEWEARKVYLEPLETP